MAEVDFSNAIIAPSDMQSRNPTVREYASLNTAWIRNSSGTAIGSGNYTMVSEEQTKVVFQYQGSFSASGTEFYIIYNYMSNYSGWKISNISFNSGDTFNFKIQADLICQ